MKSSRTLKSILASEGLILPRTKSAVKVWRKARDLADSIGAFLVGDAEDESYGLRIGGTYGKFTRLRSPGGVPISLTIYGYDAPDAQFPILDIFDTPEGGLYDTLYIGIETYKKVKNLLPYHVSEPIKHWMKVTFHDPLEK